MEQEALLVHAGQAVDVLLVFAGAERGDNDRLGLAAGEEGRTVGARQDADFRDDRTDSLEITAVDAALGVEDVPADDLGLQVLEDGSDDFGAVLRLDALGEEVGLHLRLDGVDGSVTVGLLGDLVAFAKLGFEMLEHFGFERGMVFRFEFAGFLGGNFSELDDRVDDRLETTMAEHDGAQHDVFVEFLGFGFNHQDGIARTGDDEVEDRLVHLVEMRVQNVFAVDVTNASAADRAHEGNAGERQSCGSRNHRQDVRIVLKVVLHDGNDDLGVVLVAFREERADRTVDQAGNQRFLFRRATFALEIAARNLAGGIGLFLVVDGEREEILASLRSLGGNDGRENDGLAVGRENSAVSLAGDLARFQPQRAACPFDFDGMSIEHMSCPSMREHTHRRISGAAHSRPQSM